jgi:trehalose 6-phosphate phosphatase
MHSGPEKYRRSKCVQEPKGKKFVAEFLDQLAGAQTSALLLDYDGTLAPFQTNRQQAYPYARIVPLLEEIIRCKRTRVIVVSGRPVREVQTLLSPLSHFEIWGTHGLEHVLLDGTHRQTAIDSGSASLLSVAEMRLRKARIESLAEFKQGGIAVHWRGLPGDEIENLRARILEIWMDLMNQSGLRLLNFDGGMEIRIAHPDKGDVVAAILESDRNEQIAFLGDDITDEDAFRVLNGRGLTVLVRPEYRETNAKAWIRPPQELVAFLERWLHSIRQRSIAGQHSLNVHGKH